jgi:hypothetical protein
MLNPSKSSLSRHGRMSASGHERTMRDLSNVRFTPKSGHVQCGSACPLWADFVAEVGECWIEAAAAIS